LRRADKQLKDCEEASAKRLEAALGALNAEELSLLRAAEVRAAVEREAGVEALIRRLDAEMGGAATSHRVAAKKENKDKVLVVKDVTLRASVRQALELSVLRGAELAKLPGLLAVVSALSEVMPGGTSSTWRGLDSHLYVMVTQRTNSKPAATTNAPKGKMLKQTTELAEALKLARLGENGLPRPYTHEIGEAIQAKFIDFAPERVESWWLREDVRCACRLQLCAFSLPLSCARKLLDSCLQLAKERAADVAKDSPLKDPIKAAVGFLYSAEAKVHDAEKQLATLRAKLVEVQAQTKSEHDARLPPVLRGKADAVGDEAREAEKAAARAALAAARAARRPRVAEAQEAVRARTRELQDAKEADAAAKVAIGARSSAAMRAVAAAEEAAKEAKAAGAEAKEAASRQLAAATAAAAATEAQACADLHAAATVLAAADAEQNRRVSLALDRSAAAEEAREAAASAHAAAAAQAAAAQAARGAALLAGRAAAEARAADALAGEAAARSSLSRATSDAEAAAARASTATAAAEQAIGEARGALEEANRAALALCADAAAAQRKAAVQLRALTDAEKVADAETAAAKAESKLVGERCERELSALAQPLSAASAAFLAAEADVPAVEAAVQEEINEATAALALVSRQSASDAKKSRVNRLLKEALQEVEEADSLAKAKVAGLESAISGWMAHSEKLLDAVCAADAEAASCDALGEAVALVQKAGLRDPKPIQRAACPLVDTFFKKKEVAERERENPAVALDWMLRLSAVGLSNAPVKQAEAAAVAEVEAAAPLRTAAIAKLQAAKTECETKLPELCSRVERCIDVAPYDASQIKKQALLKAAVARAAGIAPLQQSLAAEREWAAAEAAQCAAKRAEADRLQAETDERWLAMLKAIASDSTAAADVARWAGLLRLRGAAESAKDYAAYWASGCALSAELRILDSGCAPEVSYRMVRAISALLRALHAQAACGPAGVWRAAHAAAAADSVALLETLYEMATTAGSQNEMLTGGALRTALQARMVHAALWLCETGASAFVAVAAAAEEAGAHPLCLTALDACCPETPALLAALVAAGADPHARDASGEAAIHAAALMARSPAASALLLTMLPPSFAATRRLLTLQDDSGRTPLHCALVALGCRVYLRDLEALIEDAKSFARRGAPDADSDQARLERLRDNKVAKECGASAGGEKAAADAVLPLLLGAGGAALIVRDAGGRTPLALASHLVSDGDAAAAVAPHIADAIARLPPAALDAAVRGAGLHALASESRQPGAPLLVFALAAGGAADARSEDGALPLHVACGAEAVAALLRACPGSVNARTHAGEVPLFTRCAADDSEAVGELLKQPSLRLGDAARAYDKRGPENVAGPACLALLRKHVASVRESTAAAAEARRKKREEENKDVIEIQGLAAATTQDLSDAEWGARAEAALASLRKALSKAPVATVAVIAAPAVATPVAAKESPELWFAPELTEVSGHAWQPQVSREFRDGVVACEHAQVRSRLCHSSAGIA